MGDIAAWAFLVVAGTVAGVIGTSGGITSLVAYPALLVTGIPPFAANVTNSVALLGSGLSSTLRSRQTLIGAAPVLRRWTPPIVLASTGGAVLLLVTPSDVFDRVVPFLVAAGSVVLLLQPVIDRWRGDRRVPRALVGGAAAGVAVYNGYFGAGAGILLIALLLLTAEPVLHRANALKNAVLLAADALPAVLFAISGRVVWGAMLPLAIGAVLGGMVGPVVARQVPAPVLRTLIGICGLGLAAYLLLGA